MGQSSPLLSLNQVPFSQQERSMGIHIFWSCYGCVRVYKCYGYVTYCDCYTHLPVNNVHASYGVPKLCHPHLLLFGLNHQKEWRSTTRCSLNIFGKAITLKLLYSFGYIFQTIYTVGMYLMSATNYPYATS